MTTILVVRKGATACIAADTLARLGTTRESAEYVVNHEKIVLVDRTYLALTGHASLQLVCQSYFADDEAARAFGSPSEIFDSFNTMHRSLKERYFLNPKEDEDDPFESSQMDCLIANPHGIFGVYALRSVQEYTRFYALGSGYGYALGAMHAAWDRYDDPADIARAGLEAACTFDDASAMPMTLHRVELVGRSGNSPPR